MSKDGTRPLAGQMGNPDDPYGINAATGRELDTLVAEKVMGHKVTWLPTALLERVPHYIDSDIAKGYLVLPRYSTDIAAAWIVFLRCCNWVFSKRSRFLAEIQMQAITESGDVVAWPDVLVVLRHQMPLAICRAAITAVSAAPGRADD